MTIEKLPYIPPTSSLKVGDTVYMAAYTDCFGKFHPQVDGLKVESIQYIDNEHAPHWRCKAVYEDGWRYHEGAQRFFVKVQP